MAGHITKFHFSDEINDNQMHLS